MKTIMMLVLAATVAGCSWGARGVRAAASKPCSTSRAWPAVDTALAVAGAGAVGYGFSQGLRDPDPDSNRSAIIGAGVVTAIVFSAAAISGYTWAADCRGAARDGAVRHASTLAPAR
jgi:protein-S-isoprenylcysteine O-methyltransferase Ste14